MLQNVASLHQRRTSDIFVALHRPCVKTCTYTHWAHRRERAEYFSNNDKSSVNIFGIYCVALNGRLILEIVHCLEIFKHDWICFRHQVYRKKESSRVESYVTADGQSVLVSSTHLGLTTRFLLLSDSCGLLMRGALSDLRTDLRLQLLLALASAAIFGFESCGTRNRILLSQVLGFSFCRLLRLAGLRWRYSTPPPHGIGRKIITFLDPFGRVSLDE
jgi:hypothetical protein